MSSRLRGSCARFLQTFWPIAWRTQLANTASLRYVCRATHPSKEGSVTCASRLRIMAPASAPKCSSRYSTHCSPRRGSIGTGLGLWVSKQIIDKHAGTIRLRSRTEKACTGTVFSIVLPAEPASVLLEKSAVA